jgi:surface protein
VPNVPRGTQTATVTNLVSGASYECWVEASNTVGTSCSSSPSTATTTSLFVAGNNDVIQCDNAAVGDVGLVSGTEYTKRDRSGLDSLVANSSRWNELQTTCTTGVTDMSSLFYGLTSFNTAISQFDTRSVQTMADMFNGASSFNQPLWQWNTYMNSVTSTARMFMGASSFNNALNGWQVTQVTTMERMFYGASTLDVTLNLWRTRLGNVVNMYQMFYGANSFTYPLSGWQVSSVTNCTEFGILLQPPSFTNCTP